MKEYHKYLKEKLMNRHHAHQLNFHNLIENLNDRPLHLRDFDAKVAPPPN